MSSMDSLGNAVHTPKPRFRRRPLNLADVAPDLSPGSSFRERFRYIHNDRVEYPDIADGPNVWLETVEKLSKKVSAQRHEIWDCQAKLRTEVEKNRELAKMLQLERREAKEIVSALTARLEAVYAKDRPAPLTTKSEPDIAAHSPPAAERRRHAETARGAGNETHAEINAQRQEIEGLRARNGELAEANSRITGEMQELKALNLQITQEVQQMQAGNKEIVNELKELKAERKEKRGPAPIAEAPPAASAAMADPTAEKQVESSESLSANQPDTSATSNAIQELKDTIQAQSSANDELRLMFRQLLEQTAQVQSSTIQPEQHRVIRSHHRQPETPKVRLGEPSKLNTPLSTNSQSTRDRINLTDSMADESHLQSRGASHQWPKTRPTQQSSANYSDSSAEAASTSTPSLGASSASDNSSTPVPSTASPAFSSSTSSSSVRRAAVPRLNDLYQRLKTGQVGQDELARYEELYDVLPGVLTQRPQLHLEANEIVSNLGKLPAKHGPVVNRLVEEFV